MSTADVGERHLAPLFTWRTALCDSGLSSTQRHVCLALSLYMNERGGSAFPGSYRLAHDTALHVETVKRALREVVAQGWVEVVRKGGTRSGKRVANEYVAAIPTHFMSDSYRKSCASGSPELSDRKSSVVVPEAQDFPISSINSSRTPQADCFQCRGSGLTYSATAGSEGPCSCTKPQARSERDEKPA